MVCSGYGSVSRLPLLIDLKAAAPAPKGRPLLVSPHLHPRPNGYSADRSCHESQPPALTGFVIRSLPLPVEVTQRVRSWIENNSRKLLSPTMATLVTSIR